MKGNLDRAIAFYRHQTRFKLIDLLVGLGIFWAASSSAVIAQSQIVPDNTLGDESSQVVPNNEINGIPTEAIEGGAQRGSNLFHSFSQFNIEAGRGAYFANPEGINNIFSRVTGNNVSEIFGTLGVLGNADLFLINPNGIIFGENASLDVNGSFLATTASGIGFGEQGFFNADEPDTPPLLTVQPSVFVFNQVNPGTIENRSTAEAGTDVLGDSLTGLRVPDSKSLMLLGGEVIIDGGGLNAQDGRIEIIALQENQTIGLNSDSANLSFDLPAELQTNNVSFKDRASVITSGRGGGNIVLWGKEITLNNQTLIYADTLGDLDGKGIFVKARNLAIDDESRITADVVSSGSGNGGSVAIDVNTLSVNKGGTVATRTLGLGNGGTIDITADEINITDSTESNFSTLSTRASREAMGNAGSLFLNTNILKVSNGGRIDSSTLSSGDGGTIEIIANKIEIVGEGVETENFVTGISVATGVESTGNGGNLIVITDTLSLTEIGQFSSGTSGSGNGGTIDITAEAIEIFGKNETSATTEITANARTESSGNGGNITIDTNTLKLRDGGQIESDTSGSGNGGTIDITAEAIEITDSSEDNISEISVDAREDAVGNGGELSIRTNTLKLRDGGQIASDTSGSGNGGTIDITAEAIEIIDSSENLLSRISSSVFQDATGNGGDLTIDTDTLKLSNGGQIASDTLGLGDGGTIDITAEAIEIIDSTENLPSSVSVNVSEDATGNGGDLTIDTEFLRLANLGQISSATFGAGDSGNINITSKIIEVIGSSGAREDNTIFVTLIASATQPGSIGNGGNLIIDTDRLLIDGSTGGAQIFNGTFGSGDGGNTDITANEIKIIGDFNVSGAANGISGVTASTGSGGNIEIDTKDLQITDGGVVSSTTLEQGEAGNIAIDAEQIEVIGIAPSNNSRTGFSRSQISANVQPEATGNGGVLSINTNNLQLGEGGVISTGTFGSGNAGNLNIAAKEIEIIGDGISDTASRLSASVLLDGTGAGGNLSIDTSSLTVTNESSISVGSPNSLAGNLNITADSLSLDGGELVAETGVSGMGNRANINLEVAKSLFLDNEGQIRANALGDADGGNINIDTEFIVAFPAINSRGSDIIANAVGGRGGRIDITARGVFGIESRANLTAFNDITASSEFGLSGEIVFDLPQLDPVSDTLNVPEQTIETRVSQVCSTRKSDGDRSEFTVTGRGGLSQSPSNTLESKGGWEDWSDRPIETEAKFPTQSSVTSIELSSSNSNNSNEQERAIVEAQKWTVNQKGNIVLVAGATPQLTHNNHICQSH